MKAYFNRATQCVIVDNSLFIVVYSLSKGVFLRNGPEDMEKAALFEALNVLEWEVIEECA